MISVQISKMEAVMDTQLELYIQYKLATEFRLLFYILG